MFFKSGCKLEFCFSLSLNSTRDNFNSVETVPNYLVCSYMLVSLATPRD